MEHSLEPDARTLHGHFSPELSPVLTVDPGDSVTYRTLDCWWSAGPYTGGPNSERPRVAEHRPGGNHALVGPVAVRGARPGLTLSVTVDAVEPATWGTTVAAGGVVHAWTLDPTTMTGRNQHGHTVALRPFMGILGMPPAEPGRHSTIPPRRHGGNLDCKELVAGSTLYLPIPVAGALFSVGDGHAVQGDGEVSGTAIECPMDRVELTFDVRDDFPVTGPVALTPAGWVTMGLGENLDDATYEALDAMFTLIGRLHGVSRVDAVALASLAVDVRVTQIVNQTVGAHCVLTHGVIR